MSNELAKRDTAITVTEDQVALILRTVAVGATPDELKLYEHDCQRQGVHPLDKMIYFTKRKGKYTPITSIDFMRTRAADSGEYGGVDDVVFSDDSDKANFKASITVYRITQGLRCPFTATARWSEYKPDEDFMWRKMPHTMLGKCAEALALRKAFPRQLAGLYAKEEMDQAGPLDGATPEAAPIIQPRAIAGIKTGDTLQAPKPKVVKPEAAPVKVAEQPKEIVVPAPAEKTESEKRDEALYDSLGIAPAEDYKDPNDLHVTGIIDRIFQKSGTSAKGEWLLTAVEVESNRFSTFDKKFGAELDQAKKDGKPVLMHYTEAPSKKDPSKIERTISSVKVLG